MADPTDDPSTAPQRVSQICFELCGLSLEEQDARLLELCGDDPELAAAVRRRMVRATTPDTFLSAPLAANRPKVLNFGVAIGDRLGPFRITAEIHVGGMGEVFEAIREQPFEQRVAIKVVRPDLVDAQTLRRFDEERRTLARLEHPNIATIHDGGRTADGDPYLVMEYVDGERIDEYCDRKRLSIRERVRLFLHVCSAVAFAHQNTIIHRDLKPSNILVTDSGRPVLLDFGIAKSFTDMPSSTEATFLEDPEQTDGFVGTLLYASPEQARGSQLISTRSDVFSLGIILYELLTGCSPYAGTHSLMQLVDSIERQEPVPPSQILQETRELRGKELSRRDISLRRQQKTPLALQRRLRGELDAILMKALKKDANARYSSVEGLADDLKNYLDGRPIQAYGESALYMLRKLLVRHRLATVACLAVFALLLITGVFYTRQQHLQQEHQAALLRGEQEADELRNLLVNFTQLAPGDPITSEELRELIAPSGDQDWLASLLNDRGIELEEEGRFEAAEILYREALAMKERLEGPKAESLTKTLTNLGDVLAITGQFDDAEAVYKQDMELTAELFGEDSLDMSRTQLNLAVLYQDMGHLEQAADLLDASLATRETLRGRDSVAYTAVLNALAYQRYLEGNHPESQRLYEHIRRQLEALDIQPMSWRLELEARVLRNLALALQAQGDLESAESMAREALGRFRHLHVHWRVADAESVLGSILHRQGRRLEADPLLRHSVPIIHDVKGDNARQTRGALDRLRDAGFDGNLGDPLSYEKPVAPSSTN